MERPYAFPPTLLAAAGVGATLAITAPSSAALAIRRMRMLRPIMMARLPPVTLSG
jgi:hypothetical protein